MSLKLKFSIFVLIQLILFLLISFCFVHITRLNKLSIKAEEDRFESRRLVNHLQKTSDDLTNLVRLYVQTGDEKYKKYYLDTIGIRQGVIKRPKDYVGIYWDFQINSNSIISPEEGIKQSLFSLLVSAGLTDNELSILKESETLSNNLVIVETEAIAAREGQFPDDDGDFVMQGDPDISMAVNLLYGNEYLSYKSDIMIPILRASKLIDVRTKREVEEYDKLLNLYIKAVITMIVLSISIHLLSYLFFHYRVLIPVSYISTVAEHIKSGLPTEKIKFKWNDEIGTLIRNFNGMNEAMNTAIFNLKSQQDALNLHAMVAISIRGSGVEYVNSKFCEISGFDSIDLIESKHTLKKVLNISDVSADSINDTIRRNKVWHGEIQGNTNTGKKLYLMSTVAPIQDSYQKGRFIAILTDISWQKSFERELIEAKEKAEQATKMKGQFLANMSHEIRTPLNAIIGFSDLTLKIENLSEKAYDYVSKVNQSAKSLLSIINDILDFSKIDSGKMTIEKICFNLNDLLRETLSMLNIKAEEKGLELIYRYSSDIPLCCKGDPVKIRQIIINLVGNAIKFSEAGTVTVNVMIEENTHHFIVSDTGIGMTEKQVQSIFDAFSQADGSITRKFGGTGLGTTICKQLVELLGGEIWVDSVYGEGSSFHFTIHLIDMDCKESCNKKEILHDKDFVSSRNFKILLAEDNELNGELVVLNLQNDLGHHVTWMRDGRQAFEEYIKRNNDYDLILMDYQMPVLGGIEATLKIRQWEKENSFSPITIIALTASVSREDRRKCMEVGMNGFCMKPVDFSSLLLEMENIVPSYLGSPNTGLESRSIEYMDISFRPIEGIANIEQGIRTWGTPQRYANALVSFATEYRNVVEKLNELLMNGETENAIRIVHTLKGMSLGLKRINSVSEIINSYFKAGDYSRGKFFFTKLEEVLLEAFVNIDLLDLPKENAYMKEYDPHKVNVLVETLIEGLEKDTPDPVLPIIKELSTYLGVNSMIKVSNAVHIFDFDLAKKELNYIISDLIVL